jgi:hypothetical protein
MFLSRSLVVGLVLCSTSASANDVYKCTNANGDVAFQDRPCRDSASQTQVHLPDAPPPPAAAAAPPDNPPPVAAEPPAAPVLPRAPLPALWSCQNALDGSYYFSDNGAPPVRYVPVNAFDMSGAGRSAGGRSGAGAPVMSKPPVKSPGDLTSKDYAPLQDACTPATHDQACDYLRKQYDEVEHKLKRAFKDERAVLEPREQELEAQLDNC